MTSSQRPTHPGLRVAEFMKKSGMPRIQFALLSGISVRYLDRITVAKAPITLEMALKLERGTGIPAEDWAAQWAAFAIDRLRRGEDLGTRRTPRERKE